MKRLRAPLFVAAVIYLVNASSLAPPPEGARTFLAHRGVHQTYDRKDTGRDDCTATRIRPPTHDFIENTLPSIAQAFEHGAAMVEIDIHPTTDGAFAVFHDWTLDCRTDGSGVVREQPMAALRVLDAGYGYTADQGATHPLRGKGVGLIPSLDEVLDAFPDRRFLLNIKSDDPAEGEALAAFILALSADSRARLAVYGGERPVKRLKTLAPETRVFSRRSVRNCLVRYMAQGWSGRTPDACRDTIVLVPMNDARWLWGWPRRFERRIEAAGSQAYIVGPRRKNEPMGGVDTLAELHALPDDWRGGVWTDRIEEINPDADS